MNLFVRSDAKQRQILTMKLIEQVKQILRLDSVFLMCSLEETYIICICKSTQPGEDAKTLIDILTKYDPTGEIYDNVEKRLYKNYGFIINPDTANVVTSGTLTEITSKFQLHLDSLTVRHTGT